MKNYWLERELEQLRVAPLWDLNRVELLQSLIRPAAKFGIDMKTHLGQPSIFDDEAIVQDHAIGCCDQERVRVRVYAFLLRKAVEDANAVAILRKESFVGQAVGLWRSLFETEVICQYIAARPIGDHLACRFAIHSIVRATVRRWEEVNRICSRLGKPAHYTTDKIDLRKQLYQELIGKWRKNYAWASDNKPDSFQWLAETAKSDMLFYRIASNEVHPTFGQSAVLTDLSLPLSAIPLLPAGITHASGEMSLEFQTAKSLSNIIRRASDYITVDSFLNDSVAALEELSETVLRDLSHTPYQQ